MGEWGQNESQGDWLAESGLDSPGSGYGPVAGCCECGYKPSGSGANDLVIHLIKTFLMKL
jgi:hypothetical protein